MKCTIVAGKIHWHTKYQLSTKKQSRPQPFQRPNVAGRRWPEAILRCSKISIFKRGCSTSLQGGVPEENFGSTYKE
jgi:hypothetical protein